MTDASEFDREAARVHTRVVDVIRGYQELVERAEPDLRPTAERMLNLHRSHQESLHVMLEARGHAPDGDGSFMGLMQEGVIRARSWVDDLDRETLPRIAEGERQLMELYDDAAGRAPAGDRDRALLEAQRREIEEEVERMD